MEHPEPRADALQRAIPGALAVTDQAEIVTVWNPAAAELFGVPEEAALGRPLNELAIPGAELWLPLVTRARESGTPQCTAAYEIACAGAEPRHAEVAIAPLGPGAGVVILWQDVTTQVLARRRAEARSAELAQQASRRDRILSVMGHDLRTPIAALIGYSELLLDGVVGELSDAQHDVIDRMSHVAGHLAQMLNDFLDLTRLDSGRLQLVPEPVPLGHLVQEALAAIAPRTDAPQPAISTELGAEAKQIVLADPARARQILENLLSHAIRCTGEGEIRVRAGLDGDRAWISVRDSGPGLPPGTGDSVFEEFLQPASGRAAKREPESGLGLAISRRLARAMGGDLVAESAPGSGAVFTIFFPCPVGKPNAGQGHG